MGHNSFSFFLFILFSADQIPASSHNVFMFSIQRYFCWRKPGTMYHAAYWLTRPLKGLTLSGPALHDSICDGVSVPQRHHYQMIWACWHTATRSVPTGVWHRAGWCGQYMMKHSGSRCTGHPQPESWNVWPCVQVWTVTLLTHSCLIDLFFM